MSSSLANENMRKLGELNMAAQSEVGAVQEKGMAHIKSGALLLIIGEPFTDHQKDLVLSKIQTG